MMWFDGSPGAKIGRDTDLEIAVDEAASGTVPIKFAGTLRHPEIAHRIAADLLRSWCPEMLKIVPAGGAKLKLLVRSDVIPPFPLLCLVALAKRTAKVQVQAGIDLLDTADAVPSRIVEEFEEGFDREVVRNVRERDPRLVAAARLKYGDKCAVCGFRFWEVYGPHAEGFIEVHHIVPLSESGSKVTRLDEVTVLCSNCHRMIHRGKKVLTPDELRKIIEKWRDEKLRDVF